MIDIEAIRKRNEERKSGRCYDCAHAHDDSDAKADIDALLAEVDQLRAAVSPVPVPVAGSPEHSAPDPPSPRET